jgi:hypothetical protein
MLFPLCIAQLFRAPSQSDLRKRRVRGAKTTQKTQLTPIDLPVWEGGTASVNFPGGAACLPRHTLLLSPRRAFARPQAGFNWLKISLRST